MRRLRRVELRIGSNAIVDGEVILLLIGVLAGVLIGVLLA